MDELEVEIVDRVSLQELVDLLETATQGDEFLDEQIYQVLQELGEVSGSPFNRDQEAYTQDVQAIMSVLKRKDWLTFFINCGIVDDRHTASLHLLDFQEGVRMVGPTGYGNTLPLALCAATVRAFQRLEMFDD